MSGTLSLKNLTREFSDTIAVDNATLTRFFSLHYLLPFVIAGLVIVHIWAFHTTGNNNPTGVEVRRTSKADAEADTAPFSPY